ncbi:membrane protein [Streptomyces microflavus]|uniref:Membrane protein n=1 Tax=Streptomyces microflavus TaxID=1919 RepID=A0A7J0CNI5_STRMI|nr:membrane protein [Streptomyces microflavus]
MAAGEPGAVQDGSSKGGLRAALGGLTTRGRSFLAAGVAAAVCAYVLGQADLLRVGLLLAVLPLVCVIVLYRTRYRVTGTRRLSPSRVPAGSEARVHLRMDNVSRLPTGLLMLQDRVPYVLGPRPRFVLDRVEAGGRREVSYRVRSDLRGRYPLGPLQLRLSDPFGMCELTRSFSAYDTLVVIPRTVPLPALRLAGEASGYGDGRQRSLALAGEDDIIPRGYRHGDDLRRVHWRSTARYGELMVRREEQPQRARCTVLLDTRQVGYAGAGPDSAFEWAVSGAASALVHMLERGFAVRLLTDDGNAVPGDGSDGFAGSTQESADSAGLMLDTLAVVGHSDGGGLSRAHDVLRGSNEGLLIAFFGDLDEEQTSVAARMRQRTGAAVAFVLDSARWSGGLDPSAVGAVPAEKRLRQLREAGWVVVPVEPGADLPALWQLAGQMRADTQSAGNGGSTGFPGDGHERAGPAGAVRLCGDTPGVGGPAPAGGGGGLAAAGGAAARGPGRGGRARPPGSAGPVADDRLPDAGDPAVADPGLRAGPGPVRRGPGPAGRRPAR